jgi:hypothetical protein
MSTPHPGETDKYVICNPAPHHLQELGGWLGIFLVKHEHAFCFSKESSRQLCSPLTCLGP